MKRVIIGLVGPIASGKGYLAEYLISRGFAYWSLSDRVREEADRRGKPRVRNILQDIGNELRLVHGPAVLAKQTLVLVPDHAQQVVIDSIRNPMELDYLTALGATIVGVDASIENRLKWYLERAKKRGEDGASPEDFYRANARDQGEGEAVFGQQGGACLRLCDIQLFNDGTEKFLREGVEILREHFELDFDGGPEGPPSSTNKESERLSPPPLRRRK